MRGHVSSWAPVIVDPPSHRNDLQRALERVPADIRVEGGVARMVCRPKTKTPPRYLTDLTSTTERS